MFERRAMEMGISTYLYVDDILEGWKVSRLSGRFHDGISAFESNPKQRLHSASDQAGR